MAGKTSQDILNPMGLEKITEDFEGVVGGMKAEPFNTALIGGHLEALPIKCLELKKIASAIQSKIVTLDNKVNKWKDIPDNVAAEIKMWRSKAINTLTSMLD